MAAYDGSIRINTRLDTTNFNTGIQGMMGGLRKLTSLIGVAFSVTALVKFGKECVNIASDIQEVDNVVSKSFEDMREEMDALADTAIKKLGMSRLTAYQTGSTFMSMGKSMLKSTEDAKNMALSLTEMTGNMASFFNISQEMASTALKSIYTGETEVLKSYGVVMTETNLQEYALAKGIKTKYSAMSQSQKVALRYKYVMEQLNFVGSDFSDTQNSWANQTRILSEQWKEFMSIIGQGLVSVLTSLIQVLNKALAQVIAMSEQIGTIVAQMFNLQTLGADEASDAYKKLTDSVEEYEEATEDANSAAKHGLQSFDELNNLSSKKDTSSTTETDIPGLDIPGLDIPEYESKLAEMEKASEDKFADIVEAFKKAFEKMKEYVKNFIKGFEDAWKKIKLTDQLKKLGESIKNIGKSLIDIFTDPQVLTAADNFIKTTLYNLGLMAGSALTIGTSVAQALIGDIELFLQRNSDRIKTYLINMFNIGSEIMTMYGEFATSIAEVLQGVLTSDSMTSIVADTAQIFMDIFTTTTETIFKLARDVSNIVIQPFVDNKDKIAEATQGIVDTVASIVGTFADMVREIADHISSFYDEHVKPYYDSIAEGLSYLVGLFLDFWNTNMKPVLDELALKVEEVYQEHIKPALDELFDMMGEWVDLLKTVWEKWLVPFFAWLIQNILPILEPIFKGIIDGVANAVGHTIDAFKDMFAFFKNIFAMFKNLINGDWAGAWESAKGAVKSAVNVIIDIVQRMIDKIKDAINALASVFDFIGGSSGGKLLGDDFLKIPKLATGGVTTGATLAMIGEAGREAVLPLDGNTAWMDALAEKIAAKTGGSASNITISLEPDEMGIFKSVQKIDNERYRATGRASFNF